MTLSPNANWLAKNDATTKQPIFAVTITGSTWYHDYEITGATANHYKYLVKITGTSHVFNRLRLESSIGGFSFELLTSANIWNLSSLYQDRVVVKAGYKGLDWSDYVTINAGYIQNITLNDTHTGFVFYCQDVQKVMDKDVFTDATAVSPVTISARHPVTFWLQVMTSGSGSGAYDVLPAAQGLAINPGYIDVTECELIRDTFMVGWQGTWTFIDKFNAKTFFEKDIYQSFALAPVIKRDGLISLRMMLPPLLGWTQANDMGTTLTDAEIIELPKWKTEYRDIVNRITFRYNYNYVDDEYDTETVYNDTASQAVNFIQELIIESKGITTALNGLALTEIIATKYFSRYATLPAKIELKTKFSERVIEASDILEITSSHIPNDDTNDFTWTSRGAEVEAFNADYENGTIELTLRDISNGGKKYGVISPAGMVDYGSASAAQKAKYCWIGQGYYILY